jgi:hypothetical protein
MLTKTGARLLDFGLARLSGHGEQPAVTTETSAPTEHAPHDRSLQHLRARLPPRRVRETLLGQPEHQEEAGWRSSPTSGFGGWRSSTG